MTDWLTANRLTAYPFRDSEAYDDALTAVADANVALVSTDSEAYLRKLDTVASEVVIVDASGIVLIDSNAGTYATDVFGAFEIIKVFDPGRRQGAEIIIEAGSSIVVDGVDIPFALQAHDFRQNALYSINGLETSPKLILGEDFTVTETAARITINLKNPVDRVDFPPTPYVFTLDGVEPTTGGRLWLQPRDGEACQRVDPRVSDFRIELRNICEACCQCQDYYSTYIQMQGLDDQVAVGIARAATLMSRYHALVQRFQNWSSDPGSALPANTPTFARTWVGAGNPAKAVNILFRYYKGTYGGTLTLNIVNSLDQDITATEATVTVPAAIVNKLSGVIQRTTVRDSDEFAGFPGTFDLGPLSRWGSVTVANAIYNNALAGEEYAVNLELVFTLADTSTLTSSLTLTVPFDEGMTFTQPTEP